LNGDYNRHPRRSRGGGGRRFRAPILHGLCSFGSPALAWSASFATTIPTGSPSFSRDSDKPVFPGETIRLELFQEDNRWRFRARVVERNEIVLDRGIVRIR